MARNAILPRDLHLCAAQQSLVVAITDEKYVALTTYRKNGESSSTPSSGTAVVLAGADYDRARSEIKAKYGWQVGMVTFVGKASKLFGKDRISDVAVLITLD